ncbi:MAG TPA: hypothetical protein VLT86_02135 [Vicinamibacterales bacterium]|nr:hypothetical protein [Vicinamibacterales bacterium]
MVLDRIARRLRQTLGSKVSASATEADRDAPAAQAKAAQPLKGLSVTLVTTSDVDPGDVRNAQGTIVGSSEGRLGSARVCRTGLSEVFMRTNLTGWLIALALSAGAGTARSQESMSSAQALMITRVVLSIEAGSPRANGSPAWWNLAEVMKWAADPSSPDYFRDLAIAKIVDASTVRVLDYTLQLTRSDDKKHFQLSLMPTIAKADRPAWFSDDQGVIYTGKPIH